MKRNFVVLAFLTLCLLNEAAAQWQTIYKDSAHYQFNSVYFLNSDTGFVGGYDFTSGSNNGIILRTKDGGLNWDTTKLGELIICVHFIDSAFGFCGGDGGADYLTTDIGDTWQQRGFSSAMSDHSNTYFITPSLGFRSTMQSWIQKTIDTGQTWQNIFNSSGGSYFPGTSRMVFPDTLTGYLAQSRFGQSPNALSSISKTSDGGNSWFDLPIPSYFYPYSCYFFDSISGFAVGRYGEITSTTDGGNNWSSPYSISNYFLYDIAFVTDSVGYIIGGFNQYDTSSVAKGIIFKTSDRGNSWNVTDSSYFDGLTKFHFPNDSIGYAVGMNGIILKISNANSINTSVQNISNLNSFLSVYPNPFSSCLTFDGPKDQTLELVLYDVTSRSVLNRKFANQLTISTISLKNGIYFYELLGSNGVIKKGKIVKM